MVLTNAQRKRFYRIFNSFIAFGWEWLIERGLLEGDLPIKRMPNSEEVCLIEDLIWGEGGHLEIIDEFVETNTSLSRTDRRACEAWKQGIYTQFHVDRIGHDTLFLFDDYVFAVRGITDELDEWMLELPEMVTCVLVPFDGIITYLVMLQPIQIRLDPRLETSFEDVVEEARSERRYARGEREFIRMAPEALEALEALRIERERKQAESEQDGQDVVEGQHVSATYDIEDDQNLIRRMGDVLSEAKKDAAKAMVTYIDTFCLKGKPQTSLEKILGHYPVSRLREIDGSQEARRMRKADLVSKLRDRFLEDFALRAQDPRLIPLGQMADLARLCRTGGQMRVVRDEVGLDGVLPPIPFPPYVNYFRDGKDYLAVLPDEYGEAFRDADFDGLLDEARQVAEACDYLVMATDMRGLILLDEACEGIAERFELLDADDVRRLIEKDMTSPAMELDGKTYVCADDLIDWDERAQEYALERGIARKILEERVGHDPYWPSREEGAYKSVLRMAESLDEGRELLSYVRNHVPDGEDDLTFPTWILSEIVDMSINPLDPQEAVDTFTDILNDIAFNEPQAKRVAPLIMNLSKKLPRRSLNGYSPERFDEVRPDAPRNIVFLRSSR